MKKWMLWMLLGALLLFGGVFGFYYFKQVMIGKYMASMPVPVIPVTAVEVEASEWTPVINAIGFIEPVNGVILSTAEPGVVSKILFESAQKVEQGELLVQLDSVKESADLRSAESRLASVKAERDRFSKLARESLATRSQADTSAAEYKSLLAQIDSLKATLARREIRAPFDGITGIIQVQLGQYLQTGTEVVRLENIDTMKMRFIIGEQDYPRVSIGSEIQITVASYPDQIFMGSINAIEPAIDYKSGVVQLQAIIPNSEQLLRAGMYGEVRILQPSLQQQVVIPQSAIDFTLYGESVYVLEHVQPDAEDQPAYDIAKQVTVNVAERRDSRALISKGVSAGDRVVTSGQLKLSNGTRVKVVEDDTLAPPATLPRI